MALPAAMALSGLKEDCFSDSGLNDVFNHGAVLLKSPSLSSLTSSEDQLSQESGISSMSSGTSIIRNLGPFFDMLVNSQQIQLKTVVESDLPQASTSKGLPRPSEPAYETSSSPAPSTQISNTPPPPPQKIVFENRNILDLGSNIEWTNWNFIPAELQTGPRYFFENRSQYSRVLGAHMPEHVTIRCTCDDDCGYKEPQYE